MEEVNGRGKREKQDEVGQVRFGVSESGAAKKQTTGTDPSVFTRLLCYFCFLGH